MGAVLIVIIGIIEGAVCAGLLFSVNARRRGLLRGNLQAFEEELEKKSKIKKQIEELYSRMVDIGSVHKIIVDIRSNQEALKAERGRIMITQAELETVESRLRELEEIERELEASGMETKQELTLLKKKHDELNGRNENLKEQINASMQQIDELKTEIQSNARLAEQVNRMKIQIVNTEEKISVLLLQIEQGNDQYFTFKKRYDALDIEYAQLYEKFSEADAGHGDGG